MHNLPLKISVAFLTFAIGVALATYWFLFSKPELKENILNKLAIENVTPAKDFPNTSASFLKGKTETEREFATGFKIKGIGIGSTYSSVIKKLGKPLYSRKDGIVPCSEDSTLLTLHYQGLVIKLSSDANENFFFVFSMIVDSPEWSVSGVNVGSPMKNIKAKFGEPYHQSRESGLQGLHYNNNKGTDGSASFYFRGNRLKTVDLYLNYC